MAWSFNVFTGNLDQTGSSGAVVFEGEVETFDDLPDAVGDPAVGASYLVRTSTGVWLVNRRQAGIWIRKNNTGVRATDWEYGGDYPVNSVNGQTGNVSLTAADVGAAASTHGSTHHTGGTDAIAPNNISAAWANVVNSQFITGNTLLSAGRNRTITLSVVSAANVDLPYDGNQNGDILTLVQSQTGGLTATIRRAAQMSGGSPIAYLTLASLTEVGQTYTFVSNGTATGWSLRSVDTHTHNASDIKWTEIANWAPSTAYNRGDLVNYLGVAYRRSVAGTSGSTFTSTNWQQITPSTGTTSGTLAAGDDSRITGAAQKSANLSDLASASTAATNLGLGTANNVTFGSIQTTPIGSITPSSGAFTTLTANNGTITASAPALTVSQTWNASGTTFTGLDLNITNTASAAASLIANLRTGSSSRFLVFGSGASVSEFGNPTDGNNHEITIWGNGAGRNHRLIGSGAAGIAFGYGLAAPTAAINNGTPTGFRMSSGGALTWTDNSSNAISGTIDTFLRRDAANTLAQYNSTNAQTFNIYNTFTSATNHERGFLRWSSNVLQIGTEKGSGGGTARALEFQTDGTTRLTIPASGAITTNSAAFVTTNGFSIQSGNNVVLNVDTGSLFWNNGPILSKDANNILALRNSTNANAFRIYNTVSGTGNVNFDRVNFRWASNEFIIDAEAGGTGTLRGIKIGSATSSLLGFYGVTPVDQPATVADPAGGGTVDTEARTAINTIIDRLQELGLIA